MKTKKTSVAIQAPLWQQLQGYSNKSFVVNTALSFYFEREVRLGKADEEYWNRVEHSLRTGDGEYTSLNPDGEALTADILEKKLWS